MTIQPLAAPRAFMAAAAILFALTLAGRASASHDSIEDHVAKIASSMVPGSEVTLMESPSALASVAGTQVTISTGLLAALESDAQLAMIVACERARASVDRDERAAQDAMAVLVAAGWDGRAALSAWDRLTAATVLGAGYGDAKANARRSKGALRALKASGQRDDPQAGHAVGLESYRTEILAHLQGARVRAEPHDAVSLPAGDGTWMIYKRSGGFTGWTAELRVREDGRTWISQSQRRDESGPGPELHGEQLAHLRELVAGALAQPPRAASAGAKSLRDGQLRSIEVRDGETWTSVSLSDGLMLSAADHELVRLLESLL